MRNIPFFNVLVNDVPGLKKRVCMEISLEPLKKWMQSVCFSRISRHEIAEYAYKLGHQNGYDDGYYDGRRDS